MKSMFTALVRLQGLVFVFYGVIDITYLPPYYRNYRLVHENELAFNVAVQNFWSAVLRIALHFLAGYLLFSKTEPILRALRGDSPDDAK